MLFVLSAPSGTGKTTLVKRLLGKLSNLKLSVSHTTRKPRAGEQDGIDYHFCSVAEFKRLKDAGLFLENETVHGFSYGTEAKQVDENDKQGVSSILDIDTKGALHVKSSRPDAVLIFIMPPSEEELKKRLSKRATESMEDLSMRFNAAKSEIAMKDRYDYVIINDDLDKAVQALKEIIDKEMS